jgi:hypothetical protein
MKRNLVEYLDMDAYDLIALDSAESCSIIHIVHFSNLLSSLSIPQLCHISYLCLDIYWIV